MTLHIPFNDISPTEASIPGRYALSRVMGRGSMGMLYEARDPGSQRRVVLKTVRRDLLDAGDDNYVSRLRMEAEAARALDHPGIAAVYEYGETGSTAYIAMEFIEGQSLQQMFDAQRPLGVARAVDVMSQLLEALQYAHDRGVWHRDIKPANVMITPSGQVKVLDFGIAQASMAQGPEVEPIMGTPGYVAPETYLSDGFDARVDVFAAGAVLYQLLAGVPVFTGRADEVMFKVCNETPPAPSIAALTQSLQRFDPVVLKALARNPDDRFHSASSFRSALLEAFSAVR